MLRYPTFSCGQRIGLYGGSFNPPHAGHLAVARSALRRLGLHRVWWLVSPQNPLKPRDGTADYEERLNQTRALANHPHMVVTDIEAQAGSACTADTLEAMRPILEQGRFVWIMGADSFAELHRWQRWRTIPDTVPLCIFDRPGSGLSARNCQAAELYEAAQVPARNAALLPDMEAPAWSFITWPLRPESSTAIRNQVM
ncbi:MAG: nicotinate-nucleotide adenylyltransferase [Pseudomonadota bacterium]